MSFDGYDEAKKIDDRINIIYEQEAVDSVNVFEWMKLIRTVRTSLDIVEMEVEKKLKEKGYLSANKN